jgi:hypothetical protein
MEQGSGVMQDTDRGNIEKMLKMGAYSLFNDDDEKAKSFLESDIDTILSSARVIKSKQEVATKAAEEQDAILEANKMMDIEERKSYLEQTMETRLAFSRQTFNSATADDGLDLNDPDFWEKVLPGSSGDSMYRADKLLSQLTDGSALIDRTARNDFFSNLTVCCEEALELVRKGEAGVELDEVISMLIQFCELSSSFTENQRMQANMWLGELEARERRTRQQSRDVQEASDRYKNADNDDDSSDDNKNSLKYGSEPSRKSSRQQKNAKYDAKAFDGTASERKKGGSVKKRGGGNVSSSSDDDRAMNPLGGSDGAFEISEEDEDEDRKPGRKKGQAKRKKFNKTLCRVCDQPGVLLFCEGRCQESYHLACLDVEEKYLPAPGEHWECSNCVEEVAECFGCRVDGRVATEAVGDEYVRNCSVSKCGKHYHIKCIDAMHRCTGFARDNAPSKEIGTPAGKTTVRSAGSSFRCPLHLCAICSDTSDAANRDLVLCQTCPRAFHVKCLQGKKIGTLRGTSLWKSGRPPSGGDPSDIDTIPDVPLEFERLSRKKVYCPACLLVAKETEDGRNVIATAYTEVDDGQVNNSTRKSVFRMPLVAYLRVCVLMGKYA